MIEVKDNRKVYCLAIYPLLQYRIIVITDCGSFTLLQNGEIFITFKGNCCKGVKFLSQKGKILQTMVTFIIHIYKFAKTFDCKFLWDYFLFILDCSRFSRLLNFPQFCIIFIFSGMFYGFLYILEFFSTVNRLLYIDESYCRKKRNYFSLFTEVCDCEGKKIHAFFIWWSFCRGNL